MTEYRACISAGIRVSFTITYFHSDDITYSYSSVGLWTVAEVMSGFIVFSVPGIPKNLASFKNSKFILRLKFRNNPNTEAPSGHEPYHNRWKQIRSVTSKGVTADTQAVSAMTYFTKYIKKIIYLRREKKAKKAKSSVSQTIFSLIALVESCCSGGKAGKRGIN